MTNKVYIVKDKVFDNKETAEAYRIMKRAHDELNGGFGAVRIVETEITNLNDIKENLDNVVKFLNEEEKGFVKKVLG